MKILIYGFGEMGSLFYNFFSSRGYFVRGFDLIEEKREVGEDDIKDFDVIFLCVPMEEIASILESLSPLLSNQLLVDISSIKALSTPFLEKFHLDYLSIHPLFGGDSEILSDIIITHESGRKEEKAILNEFENAGARLIRMRGEEHDSLMTIIQGISHFVLLALASFADFDWRKAETPIFGILHELAERIAAQDWRMSYLIQKNAEKVRKRFLEHLIGLNEVLESEIKTKKLFKDLEERYRRKDFMKDSLIVEAWKACREVKGLQPLRSSINKIDLIILKLLEKRVELARRIAHEKGKARIPIENPEVEERKLEDLSSRTSLNPLLITSIFEEIIRLAKEEEYRVLGVKKKLAILGPPGSYSEEVALKLVSSRLPIRYCSSIQEVVKLAENDCYGVIPIENSISGTVYEALDALLNHKVEVFGEARLQIKHCLAAKKRMKMDEIKVVYSHPQAIAQCMDFIRNYLPGCEIRYTSSTSDAAKLLESATESAAVLSENAAKLFRLHILRRIGNQESVTRFYLIRKAEGMMEKRSDDGEWVTSLFFEVENRPGALKEVLEIFYEKGINLRKLESRPRGFGNYIFFAELEACLNEKDLEILKKVTTFYKLIGAFKEVKRIEMF